MLTTTLKEIRSHTPCEDGWNELLSHLGKTNLEAKTDETPLPIMTVLESNGLDDALWVLDHCANPHICRLFAADCAESVLHLFEKVHPHDQRPRKAIAVARNLSATERERNAAGAAVLAARAAARDAARDAALVIGAAARAASWAAAGASWAASWAAALAASGDAAGDAALAAGDAASAASLAGAGGDTRGAQKQRLRQYLEHGEAAADMPWSVE